VTLTFLYWIFYAGTGRIVIFFSRKFLLNRFVKQGYFRELLECDLCLGFWVYALLSYLFDVNLAEFLPVVISQALTGMIMSFIMYLVVAGWNAKFSNIIVEVT